LRSSITGIFANTTTFFIFLRGNLTECITGFVHRSVCTVPKTKRASPNLKVSYDEQQTHQSTGMAYSHTRFWSVDAEQRTLRKQRCL